MRRLVITRGPQGAGKSTALRRLGLEPWTLSGDALRQVLSGPVMGRDGRLGISQDQDRRVWPMLFELLEERMERGELVVVDATHPNASAMRPYLKLAERWRYRVACLDFGAMPLALALARNRQRPEVQQVPEHALERTWEACQRGRVAEGVHVVPWQEDDGHLAALEAWLTEPELDLSDYRGVLHIGDLQGCATPLLDGLLAEGLPDGYFTILVGDLCDRGLENGRVMRWVLEHAHRPDLRIHWGNHEDHLHRWVRGLEVWDPEFTERTLPQLREAGVTEAEVDALLDGMVDVTRYRWRDHRVLVTHGGVPTLPEHPERLSSRQYSVGVGPYHDRVDGVFDARAPAGQVQVHGHRNPWALPVQAAPRSFNLEGQVEHGGALRALFLDARGFTPVEVPNPRYRTLAQRLALGDPMAESPLNPPWVRPDMPPPVLAPELLDALRGHTLITEKAQAVHPHVSSFNFSRDAFYQREWDALNTTARGLFVNNVTGEVIARSYDKFFNVGERPETAPAALARSLRFPVTLYLKENGFLGILGYDSARDELVWASKSSLESEFAGWFRELAEARLDEPARVRLKRYLRDTQSAMAFEVVDPVRDPHIIAYDEPVVVLLDVIRRGPAFERAPYETLVKVGRHFELPVKQRAMTFNDWAGLSRWMEVANAPGWTFQGRPVEGFVLEDSAGFLTKLKLDHYSFWKRMRSLKDRLVKVRAAGQGLGRDLSEPRVRHFHDWAIQQSDELLGRDIIAVRAAYEAGGGEPWTPPADRPDKDLRGFVSMLEGLAGRDAPIKRGTADAALRQALADDRKLALLRDSPVRVALVLAATPGEQQEEAAERLGLDLG